MTNLQAHPPVGLQVSLNRPARLILASRGLLLFFLGLRLVCINFSCPVNAVLKSVVDAYLRRNPVMRGVWEAKGSFLRKALWILPS